MFSVYYDLHYKRSWLIRVMCCCRTRGGLKNTKACFLHEGCQLREVFCLGPKILSSDSTCFLCYIKWVSPCPKTLSFLWVTMQQNGNRTYLKEIKSNLEVWLSRAHQSLSQSWVAKFQMIMGCPLIGPCLSKATPSCNLTKFFDIVFTYSVYTYTLPKLLWSFSEYCLINTFFFLKLY
jgi:hypothetical protein